MKVLIFSFILLFIYPLSGKCQGFDTTYALGPTNPYYGKSSTIKNLLADSNMILFSGFCRRDTVDLSAFTGLMPMVGATDYQGNLLWWKGLSLDSPKYYAGDQVYFQLLAKISNDKYVMAAMGLDGINGPSNGILTYPYLLFFNSQGDTLKLCPIPTYNDAAPYPPFTEVGGLCIDQQKNILVTGRYSNTYEFYATDTGGLYIAKFDSNGVFQWKKHYPYAFDGIHFRFQGYKILPANEGNGYMISSYKPNFDSLGSNVFHFVRIDANGNILWEKDLPKANTLYGGGDNFERADFIIAMDGSGYYFNSREYAVVTETELSYMSYIGKIDNQAKVVWGKTIEFENKDVKPFDIAQLDNGNLVFNISIYDPYTQGGSNFTGSTLLCTDSLGNIKWHKAYRRYHCPGILEYFKVMSKSPYNNIVMGGYEANLNSIITSCYPSIDEVSKLALVDTLGRRNTDDTAYLYFNPTVTEVVYPTVGIDNRGKDVKKLVDIYPNPAQSDLFISIKEKGNYKIVVTDVTGRQQYEKTLKADITQVNIGTWQAGIYYLQIFESGVYVGSFKLVKQ